MTAAAEIAKYKNGRELPDIDVYRKQYEPDEHAIMKDYVKYPKREVISEVVNPDSSKTTKTDFVEINRIPLSYQKEIVNVAVTFLFGKPVKYINNIEETEMFDACKKAYDNLKFQDMERQIAENCSKFTECAVFLYNVAEPNEIYGFKSEGRIYAKLLTPDIYGLYPIFDSNGNMTSFGREFKLGEKQRFEVYTDNEIIIFENDEEIERKENLYGKIPFVYFNYSKVEWHDVQGAIERLEAIYSNAAESNDKFAFPILAITGNIQGQISKDKSGKVMMMKENAKAEFLEHPNALESLEKEIERLERAVRNFTATPDFSFGNLISIANVLASGNGKALFLQPHLKVMQRTPMYVSNFKRVWNVLRAFIVYNKNTLKDAKLDVTPVITPFTIDNEEALAKFLMEVNGGQPLLSHEYSVERFGISEPDKMVKKIQDEANKRVELTNANDFNL